MLHYLPEAKPFVLDFTAYQPDTTDNISLSLSFEMNSFQATKNKVCGTILNELFRWVELQRKINAKGFKLSQPILIRFNVAGMKFDSGSVRKEARQTLKLQNNPDGRARYAKKFNAIFHYATMKVECKDVHELIAGLEKAILGAAKAA